MHSFKKSGLALAAALALCVAGFSAAQQPKDAPQAPPAKGAHQQPPARAPGMAAKVQATAALPASVTNIFPASYDDALKLFQTGTLNQAQEQSIDSAVSQYEAALPALKGTPDEAKGAAMLAAMKTAAAKPRQFPSKSFK